MKKNNPLTMPSIKIKMFECKLCKYKGIKKEVRKHIRENHFWRGQKSLTIQVNFYEFK